MAVSRVVLKDVLKAVRLDNLKADLTADRLDVTKVVLKDVLRAVPKGECWAAHWA